jgi:tetratricopeptide (TPR) repeat protein
MSRRSVRLAYVALAAATILASGCARTPEERYSRFLDSGKRRLEQKDFPRAALEFNNAAHVLPKKAEPYYQLGLVYLAQRQYNLAVLSFQKATKMDPNHAAARLRLADLMTTSSKPEVLQEVERMAEKVLSIEPDSGEALRVRAMAELKLGRPEEAARTLQQGTEKAPKSIQTAASLAAMKLAANDLPGAEAVMQKLTEASPKSADAWLALSHFYRLVDKKPDADAAIRKAIEVHPENVDALFELALMQVRSRQMNDAGATFARLAASGDPRFRAHHAMFLFDTGKRDEAIREFEGLVSKYPDDRQTRTGLVIAYTANNRVDDAGKLLDQALKRNPKDVDALELRARIYLAAGKVSEADQDLNTVLHFRPDSADAHYLRAKAFQARNERQSYQQELGEALRLRPEFIDARLETSRSLRATRHPDTALTYLDQAPAAQKGRLDWVVERNWALFDLRKDAELRDILDRALKVVRDRELLLQQALLDMRQKRYGPARSSLDEILVQDPENYRAVDTMLALFLAQNQRRESVEWLKLHAVRRERSAPMQHVLAQWLQATGDVNGAREAYLRAASLDEKFKPAKLELAKLDLAEGKTDSARQRVDGLLADDHRDLTARLVLGAVEEKAGNLAKAMETYELILQADPENVVALNNLASLLNLFGKNPEAALPYAEKAYQLAAASPAVNDTLGWVYFQKQIYQRAVPHLETAVRLQPTPSRETHLALAYYKAGQRQLAAKTISEALKMQPDSVEAQLAAAQIGWR